jgi:hypothetical protein
VPTIIRARLGDSASTDFNNNNTVTTTIQVPVTKTYRLDAVTHHTTVTVTVQRTLTRLVVVGEPSADAPDASTPAAAAAAAQTAGPSVSVLI